MIHTRNKGSHEDNKELAKCGEFAECFLMVALFNFNMVVAQGGVGPSEGSSSG